MFRDMQQPEGLFIQMEPLSYPRTKPARVGLLLAGTALAIFLCGCAVLTKSQFTATASFARATTNYTVLPGGAILSYAEVNRFNRLLDVSAGDFQDDTARQRAWTNILKALKVEGDFKAVADHADAALGILDRYSALLTLLSSDVFTDALETDAAALGKSVDADIAAYNANFRQGKDDLKPAGSIVAAVVRGGGGIFLRARQARLLRDTVANAAPTIELLTAEVSDLMLVKVKPVLVLAEDRLGDSFQTAAQRSPTLPLSTVTATADTVARIHTAEQLCGAAAKLARRYAAAHGKLAGELTRRKTLKGRIEEIQMLADEIKAAQTLKNSLDK
jgi:hypothetical protein